MARRQHVWQAHITLVLLAQLLLRLQGSYGLYQANGKRLLWARRLATFPGEWFG